MQPNNECPICLDEIDAVKNRSTTECGHCFHSSCLIKHSILANIACPLCRSELADIPEEDDYSEDSYYSDSSSDDEGEGSEESEEEQCELRRRTITQVLSIITCKNLTTRNLVSALISMTYQPEWVNRHFIMNDADDKEDEIMEILENITSLPVDHRDARRYADVVRGVEPVSEAGIGPALVIHS
jgi:hypothetical protein